MDPVCGRTNRRGLLWIGPAVQTPIDLSGGGRPHPGRSGPPTDLERPAPPASEAVNCGVGVFTDSRSRQTVRGHLGVRDVHADRCPVGVGKCHHSGEDGLPDVMAEEGDLDASSAVVAYLLRAPCSTGSVGYVVAGGRGELRWAGGVRRSGSICCHVAPADGCLLSRTPMVAAGQHLVIVTTLGSCLSTTRKSCGATSRFRAICAIEPSLQGHQGGWWLGLV